jgi:hypothetical protein
LPGNEEIHLTPATSKPSPRNAGKAMIRLALCPGKRRKRECGKALNPAAWAR